MRKNVLAVEGATNPHKLALEQAAADIERQRTRVAEIRTNAGVVIAGTSLVGSFLGARVIELENGSHGASDVALVVLIVGLAATCRALWPLRDEEPKRLADWVFKKIPQGIRDWSRLMLVWRHSLSPEELAGDEASQATALRRHAEVNQMLLDRRADMLMAAIFLLFIQTVLWAAVLMDL